MNAFFPFVQGDRAIKMISLALLMKISAQCLFTPSAELGSELTAWTMLPVLFRILHPRGVAYSKGNAPLLESASLSSMHLWIIALGICIYSGFKAEIGVLNSLPILFPLLLISAKTLKLHIYQSMESNSWGFLTENIYGSTIVSLLGIYTLGVTNLAQLALSLIPICSVLGVILVVSSQFGRSLPQEVNVEFSSSHLAARILLILATMLTVETNIFGFSGASITTMLTLGLGKAFAYYFMTQTIVHSSWSVPILIETFGLLSASNPFKESSDLRAFSTVVASLLVLGQIVQVLPHHLKGKSTLWVFALATIVPYLANIWAIHAADSTIVKQHPIVDLMEKAQLEFHNTLHRQSNTYAAACEEYRRRYNIEPPPGFEEWYQFATENQSPIIDDFDAIYHSIRPMWKLSGKEIHENIQNARNLPDSELWSCTFFGRLLKTQCSHAHRRFDRHIQQSLDSLLDSIPATLPDITLLVNHLDEPRVIRPPSTDIHKGVDIHDKSRQDTWHTITDTCTYQNHEGQHQLYNSDPRHSLPFVIDPTQDKDLCHHPEYRTMHGMLQSPTSFRPIKGPVPILSTGALSPMGDILYPSPAYTEPEFQYNAAHDKEWGQKHNNLYWAGSTTGAFAADPHWRHFHRQRFVSLAQGLDKRPVSYLQESRDGAVSLRKSSFLNSRLYDVVFTRILHCEPKYCRDQRHFFHMRSWAEKDKGLQSRLVFDLDGNGISGRFYGLLASKSAPLKQTLFREWHDDRLKPWVHYVPVSQGMEELPEIVRYLLSSYGEKKARQIAENGHRWFARAFRPVDSTIYLYRLLLEIARLQDIERPALFTEETV